MIMTNYMELLTTNQPWNLIAFMVIPVVLAESLVATEFYTMFLPTEKNGNWKAWNHRIGILAGIYFSCVVLYLLTAVVPTLQWRGIADEIAIGTYLLSGIPLLAITLQDLGIVGKHKAEQSRRKSHFKLLIGFLIINHIAMVFGMVNPTITGWQPSKNVSGQMTTDMTGHDMTMTDKK